MDTDRHRFHRQNRRYLVILTLLLFACNFPLSIVAPDPTPTRPSGATVSTPPTPLPPSSPTLPLPDSPTPPLPSTPTPAPSATVGDFAYQPVFEPAPCAFPVPTGYSPECGFLVVPEDRAEPESRSIRLHVAVFRSHSETPAPDPVVLLAGGPGSPSLEMTDYLFSRGLDTILERQDFVLFDQRGTGFSDPRLDCPEREALAPALLEGSLSPEGSGAAILEAFHRCRERLISEGTDPSAYTSAASAADVNDLRLALGYEQLNLYAVSYGTRLALTILRDHPEAVRSAVFDSTYPLQVNLYTALAPNAERAFEVLFERCAADPGCSAAYPDLEAVFYALVDRLNAGPETVTLAAGGAERAVSLTGDLLIDVLFVGLYNPSVAGTMPRMIFDVQQGNYAILRERLSLYFDNSSALGMGMAVQCAEEIPFGKPEEAFTAAQGVQPQIAGFFPASVQPLFAVCQDWSAGPLDPRENQPVHSDVPALVLAGEYDPITPPGWGRMVAEDLSHAHFYEFPGNGHWVTRSSTCALEMALAFWEEPGVPPDSNCMGSLTGLDFDE